jgi:molecular chaperone HtpG
MGHAKPQTNSVKTGARLLETLTSALYAAPIVVFREYVQNAIDSFSSSSSGRDFKVEISIDFTKNMIVIRDNGDGIPRNEFNKRMSSLGKSAKEGRENQIGFRGIGRLAGLSFCRKLHFINKADPHDPMCFSLNGDAYRRILLEAGGGSSDLSDVMRRIISTSPMHAGKKNSDCGAEPGFEVRLEGVGPELMDCICLRKPRRGRPKKVNAEDVALSSDDKQPTDDFINELSMLLPVPYAPDFGDAAGIRQKHKEWFGTELASREFNVLLNGKQLFKPFKNIEGMAFQILPVQLLDLQCDSGMKPQVFKTIGLLWISFDYVFKAVKQNWGIAVRSKNMLVRGGSVLAEEAAEDRDAITSYGQYLSAIKGVTGEMLLETNCLSDNSRRDWFKVDKNSMQLRSQLCHLMNRMHNYRYKISRYMHNDKRTEAEKQSVILAYSELISQKDDGSDITAVEQYISERFQKEGASEIDDRADERDILGYTLTQKRFYKTLMMAVYEYFGEKDITKYYALKSHIVRKLNSDSTGSEGEATTGGD